MKQIEITKELNVEGVVDILSLDTNCQFEYKKEKDGIRCIGPFEMKGRYSTVNEVKEFKCLNLEKTKKMVMSLIQYPNVVKEAAEKRIPHRISQYVLSLAATLHGYYNDEKILTEDQDEMNEKLTLLNAVRIVLKDSLSLLGVSVKEEM